VWQLMLRLMILFETRVQPRVRMTEEMLCFHTAQEDERQRRQARREADGKVESRSEA
jgi:hypothetical protein